MEQRFIEMGKRIKSRRKSLHIKQIDLAKTLGISNNHRSSIEAGKQRPSLEIFVKICDELKVTPDYLLLGNMHPGNVPYDITDALRVCGEEDIELARKFVELLVERNRNNWNGDEMG